MNYIETIKKERIKKYFCEGVSPRQFDALWKEEGKEHDASELLRRKNTQLPGRPREKLEHCLAPFVCVIDLRTLLVSYQHINLSSVHSFKC